MTRPEDLSALVRLLEDLFDVEELRRFAITTPRCGDLADHLPGAVATPAAVAFAVAKGLYARGLIDLDFFERLRITRAIRVAEIDAVAARFTADVLNTPERRAHPKTLWAVCQQFVAGASGMGMVLLIVYYYHVSNSGESEVLSGPPGATNPIPAEAPIPEPAEPEPSKPDMRRSSPIDEPYQDPDLYPYTGSGCKIAGIPYRVAQIEAYAADEIVGHFSNISPVWIDSGYGPTRWQDGLRALVVGSGCEPTRVTFMGHNPSGKLKVDSRRCDGPRKTIRCDKIDTTLARRVYSSIRRSTRPARPRSDPKTTGPVEPPPSPAEPPGWRQVPYRMSLGDRTFEGYAKHEECLINGIWHTIAARLDDCINTNPAPLWQHTETSASRAIKHNKIWGMLIVSRFGYTMELTVDTAGAVALRKLHNVILAAYPHTRDCIQAAVATLRCESASEEYHYKVDVVESERSTDKRFWLYYAANKGRLESSE